MDDRTIRMACAGLALALIGVGVALRRGARGVSRPPGPPGPVAPPSGDDAVWVLAADPTGRP